MDCEVIADRAIRSKVDLDYLKELVRQQHLRPYGDVVILSWRRFEADE